MKVVITIFSLFFTIQIFGQNCGCKNEPELKNVISCKKTTFENGAQIFWNYDCNSSSLIFVNKNLKKEIFSLDKELMELSGRLGYSNWTEYKKSFLIENRLISGCCDPSEYILFNKNNGRIISNLGTFLFLSDKNEKMPFVITLQDLETIFITNLTTNEIRKIKIPKGRLEKSLGFSNFLFADYLFEKIIFQNNIFTIKYNYKVNKKDKWKIKIIKINVEKYGR